MIFDKGKNSVQWSKHTLSYKKKKKNKTKNSDSRYRPYTFHRNELKWSKHKYKITKLLGDHIEEKRCDLGYINDFLDTIPKS